MQYTTLISASSLAAHLDDAACVICDCRHDLVDTEAGRRAYRESHLPGARFVHLDEDLSAPKTGRNGRHPLPDPARIAQRLGELGIGNDTQVVAYDASGGYYAARLWWMLRWMGHGGVAVLDGGWNAWTGAGLPVTAAPPSIRPARFTRRTALAASVTAEEILRELAGGKRRLLDARAPNRFRGENETLDPVAGHIKGAVNRFFQNNLDSRGCFKPPAALRSELEAALGGCAPGQVTHYCGSGVTACHNLLAMEVAGLNGSRLYPGSWSEWCSDPFRPVARGDEEPGPTGGHPTK
jgi:thiosulfate/3-mercaptopyruvate sulfurtransferase